MGSSLVITLREGLEASLVLAILLNYLRKIGRQGDAGSVWFGTAIATLACLVAGVLIYIFIDGLHGKVEQAVEGTIALASVIVLTRMIFWMRENSRALGTELRSKVDHSAQTALFTIAFVAVAREGLETVLFLLSAKTQTSSGPAVVFGGLIGIAAAIVIGVLVYRGSDRINLKTFFKVTAVLLLLFAAGLTGKAVHEFRELLGFETGWLFGSAWNVKSGMWASGTFHDFVKGLFGWVASPERIRVIVYFAYFVPVVVLYRRDSQVVSPTAVTTSA